jgi:hypothetical protein
LFVHQQARFSHINHKTQRLALDRALSVILRRESVDFLIKNIAAGRRRQSGSGVFRPHLIVKPDNNIAQQSAGFLRLRSVQGQASVKQSDIGRQLCQFRALRIVGTLSRGRSSHDGNSLRLINLESNDTRIANPLSASNREKSHGNFSALPLLCHYEITLGK